jgi:MoaA/NifB/PqqE/SkfB family radical SAM enzyme
MLGEGDRRRLGKLELGEVVAICDHLAGPVVIWNLIRRCNLTCKHCYSISADKDFPGELSTDEVFG